MVEDWGLWSLSRGTRLPLLGALMPRLQEQQGYTGPLWRVAAIALLEVEWLTSARLRLPWEGQRPLYHHVPSSRRVASPWTERVDRFGEPRDSQDTFSNEMNVQFLFCYPERGR